MTRKYVVAPIAAGVGEDTIPVMRPWVCENNVSFGNRARGLQAYRVGICDTPADEPSSTLRDAEAQELAARARTVFQPRAPIATPEFFAGRWEPLATVIDSVAQVGLHIVLLGERGTGKTSLVNILGQLLYAHEAGAVEPYDGARLVVKVHTHNGDSFSHIWRRAFDEMYWHKDKPISRCGYEGARGIATLREALDLGDAPSIDEVRRTLALLKGSVFIFDEFDQGSLAAQRSFAGLIKALSDDAVDTTVVLVGASDMIADLTRDHASVARSIVQIELARMTDGELQDILHKASEALDVVFSRDAASLIIAMAQGLPHYVQLLGLYSTREAAKRLSRRVDTRDVHASFANVIQHTILGLREKHLQAIRSAHKSALFRQVLLACASAACAGADPVGYFSRADVVRPIRIVLNRPDVGIATFQQHINEFCEQNRGPVLERSGGPRACRYRFRDPLLVPLIFMDAVSQGLIDAAQLTTLTVAR